MVDALFHFHCSAGTRAGGASAVARCNYVVRAYEYDDSKGGRDKLSCAGSGNMPAWAEGWDGPFAAKQSAVAFRFWLSLELYERKNALLFKELEFSLPARLTMAQQVALVRVFAAAITQVPGGALPYCFAMHAGHGLNPHVHMLVCQRVNDGLERDPQTFFSRAAVRGANPVLGGARKCRLWDRRDHVSLLRKAWESHVNLALESAGLHERVDCRSYADRGIERTPTRHVGRGRFAQAQRLENEKIVELNEVREEIARLELLLAAADASNANVTAGESDLEVSASATLLQHERTIEAKRAVHSLEPTQPSAHSPFAGPDAAGSMQCADPPICNDTQQRRFDDASGSLESDLLGDKERSTRMSGSRRSAQVIGTMNEQELEGMLREIDVERGACLTNLRRLRAAPPRVAAVEIERARAALGPLRQRALARRKDHQKAVSNLETSKSNFIRNWLGWRSSERIRLAAIEAASREAYVAACKAFEHCRAVASKTATLEQQQDDLKRLTAELELLADVERLAANRRVELMQEAEQVHACEERFSKLSDDTIESQEEAEVFASHLRER